MNSDLLFDFTVDKAAKMAFIKREFAAEHSLVWDAFTKQETLDHMERLFEGFQQGFTATLKNLENLLASLS
jgi:hypothetical protein